MAARLDVAKTYKLFIGGGFPRTESGRSMPVRDGRDRIIAHLCLASRKDLRDAVEAARDAFDSWADRTAYNRGQILYRMAEMLEGKRDEFIDAIRATRKGARNESRARSIVAEEVDASIDRLVAFAGWADKYSQVLGGHNPVNGPYYNFTIAEPTGVVGVVVPDEPALLGLITLMAPPLCAGCTLLVIASQSHPVPGAILGEVCATSDVPPGVVNILTGSRAELLDQLAQHRDVDAISSANLTKSESTILRLGSAENVKRVRIDTRNDDDWYDPDVCESPWTIEPFVEMKTIWHPSAT